MQTLKQIARFSLPASYFNLGLLVHSHGWVRLSPFTWDDKRGILGRHENLNGKLVHLSVKQSARGASVSCRSSRVLTAAERKVLRQRSSYMLGLEIDLEEFIHRARSLDQRIYRFARGGGARMLRGSTLFEDVVKTLFTTNASWAFTRQMCQRLVAQCTGRINSSGHEFFPPYQMVQEMRMSDLMNKCKLGYRAQYLLNVVKAFHENGELEKGTPREIVDKLSQVKGLGPYCINHIAILLGEYAQIPVDSEVRSYCKEIGLSAKEETILEHYSRWHPFEFLAFRMERRIRRLEDG